MEPSNYLKLREKPQEKKASKEEFPLTLYGGVGSFTEVQGKIASANRERKSDDFTDRLKSLQKGGF